MSNAPIQQPLINRMMMVTKEWAYFFTAISRLLLNKVPTPSGSYTVATVPDATLYTGNMIFVSNETGGATIAFSDGINWRRVQDRTIIS